MLFPNKLHFLIQLNFYCKDNGFVTGREIKKNAIVEFVTKAITALDDKFKAIDVYLYFKNTFNLLASKISYEGIINS